MTIGKDSNILKLVIRNGLKRRKEKKEVRWFLFYFLDFL